MDFFNHEIDRFYSTRMVKTPRLLRNLAYWAGGLFLFMLACLFLPWTQNITSAGVVTTLYPEHRPQTIHSTIAGRIERWYIQEGQYATKGDTIVKLSEVKEKFMDPELLTRLKEQIQAKEGAITSTQRKVQALENQISALRSGLEFSLNKARNKVKQTELKLQADSMDFQAAKVDFEVAELQFARQEELYKKGLKSLTELEQRKLKLQESKAKLLSSENKYEATKNELANARIELNSLQAEYQDKISKAQSDLNSAFYSLYDGQSDLSKMINEYANMEIRSGYYAITAPQDGYIVKALVTGIGETVKEGEPIVSVMPDHPSLAAQIFVAPMDIPLLKKGSKVRLQFDGWPALVFSGWPNTSFGTFGARVEVIDFIDSKGKYRVLVTPDPADEPWPPVRVGSGVQGWALLNDVPIWYELWRQLNGFPPDFTGYEQVLEHDIQEYQKKNMIK
ncbi:MAG: HlyD family secretion protein [Cytophagaceae bacterium]